MQIINYFDSEFGTKNLRSELDSQFYSNYFLQSFEPFHAKFLEKELNLK